MYLVLLTGVDLGDPCLLFFLFFFFFFFFFFFSFLFSFSQRYPLPYSLEVAKDGVRIGSICLLLIHRSMLDSLLRIHKSNLSHHMLLFLHIII